jgi:putative transposase
MTWKPLTFFAVAVAGWMNRQQQDAIEFLKEENKILREKLGPKRLLLSDEQKRRLATKGKILGRKLLEEFGTLFAPDTILKWHRMLVARKYDGSAKRRPGPEPKKANMIRDHVLRMAEENPGWGYGRIHGELKVLGYDVHWQTVRRVMREHGLLDDPDSPEKLKWITFLRSHWETLAACDFFTVEAWTPTGLTRFLVFFVIDIATRRVRIAGIDRCPNGEWMLQQARNLTDAEDGFLNGKRLLIHDRDPLFTEQFRTTLGTTGVRALKFPPRSPNLNAYAESYVRGVRRECLDKMILFGEAHVRHVVESYAEHYNKERPHQGLGNRRIEEPDEPPPEDGPVLCRERLGGLLRSYYRGAA